MAEKPLIFHAEFLTWMGAFQGHWAALDCTIDVAIWKFLNITPGQAHLITSGMMFGRKARLLADLVGRSEHPKKDKILGAFNKLRGDNKRDVIIHGYIRSSPQTVTFVERSVSGEFKAKSHIFTLEQFKDHVKKVIANSAEFNSALGYSSHDLTTFTDAAFSLDRKSSKSPVAPEDSA